MRFFVCCFYYTFTSMSHQPVCSLSVLQDCLFRLLLMKSFQPYLFPFVVFASLCPVYCEQFLFETTLLQFSVQISFKR